jgi:hypothetical protein
MRLDVDSLLLDRLFQPVADRAAGRVTCFGLARTFLLAAVLLQVIVTMIDLRVATASACLLGLAGAQQAWCLITRTERQAQPGGRNLRRITLRWQRLAWLAVTPWSVAAGISVRGGFELGLCGTSVAWLGLIYFVSCTPA